jgi:pimeloyl-ACP methyl ester carboxylesterase
MLLTPLSVAASSFAGLASWDGSQMAAQLEVPLLVIIALKSMVPSLVASTAEMPNLTIGQVVGSGHFPQLQVPDQVNAMMTRFLEIHGLSSSGG